MQTVKSSDDCNSIEFLRSRIDQQSELICILKRRADEYLEKVMKQEEQIISYQEQTETLEKELTNQKLIASLCEERYENTIKQRRKLLTENAALKDEIDSIRNSNNNVDVESKKLKETIRSKENCIKELQAAVDKNKENALYVTSNQLKEYKASLNKKFKNLKEQVKSNRDVIEIVKRQDKMDLEMLKEYVFDELKKLHCAATNFCSTLEEKASIIVERNKEIVSLKNIIATEKRNVQLLEEKIASTNECVEKTKIVTTLKDRVNELEEELSSHTVQFDAYKSHTNDLLMKEREMNAKLRRLKKNPRPGVQEEK